MPKIVARRLQKLQRDFLWGGGILERKVHLVNWEVVCAHKENGGLGIRGGGVFSNTETQKFFCM